MHSGADLFDAVHKNDLVRVQQLLAANADVEYRVVSRTITADASAVCGTSDAQPSSLVWQNGTSLHRAASRDEVAGSTKD